MQARTVRAGFKRRASEAARSGAQRGAQGGRAGLAEDQRKLRAAIGRPERVIGQCEDLSRKTAEVRPLALAAGLPEGRARGTKPGDGGRPGALHSRGMRARSVVLVAALCGCGGSAPGAGEGTSGSSGGASGSSGGPSGSSGEAGTATPTSGGSGTSEGSGGELPDYSDSPCWG